MNDLRENLLREDLAKLAALVKPVEFHDRVLAASSRARVRSLAGGALALALLAGAGVGIAAWRAPDGDAPPSVGATTLALIPDGQIFNYNPISYNMEPGALARKSLDLPAWPGAAHCPSGRLTFVKGGAALGENGATVTILTVESADVDGDGSADQVAILQCEGVDQGGHVAANGYQAIAFTDIDAAAGPRTLGQVVASGTGGIAALLGLEVTPTGTVRVKVADGDDEDAFTAQVQTREYQWQGTRFGQTGGETAFAANPPEVRLVLGATVESASVEGKQFVALDVVVLNSGTVAPRGPLVLSIVVPTTLKPVDPTAWAGCVQSREAAVEDFLIIQCAYPAALGPVQYTFWRAEPTSSGGEITVGIDQGADRVLERDTTDNQAALTLP